MKVILKLLSIGIAWLALIILMSWYQIPLTILGRVAKGKRIKKNYPAFEELSYNFWIAQDQFVNAICGGNPDITVSSRIGYWSRLGNKTAIGMEYFVNFLFYVAVGQKDHCRVSIEHDEEHGTAW